MTFSFGNTSATTANSSFSFGANKPASSTGFSFGNTATTSTPAKTGGFSFGSSSTPAATTTSGFSFGNTSTAAKPASSGFSFGNTSATKSSFGGFGAATTTNNANTAQDKANEKLKTLIKPEDHQDQLAFALQCPHLYGDERDTLIAKWNQVQAAWGNGRAIRHGNIDPIQLSARNMFCRFKAIGYSRIPENKDKDGLVWLQIDKNSEVVREHQNQFVTELQKLLGAGNQLNIAIKVDAVKSLPDAQNPEKSNRCEMAIYVQEQMNISTGAAPAPTDTYRVPSDVLYGNFKQIEDKLKNMGISNIIRRVAYTSEELQQYLDKPPQGISEIQWSEAKKHNPDPKKLLPVPMLGFETLNKTHTHQRLQSEQQSLRLNHLKAKLQKLQDATTERQQKIVEHRKDADQLSRKMLRLICRQEIVRNVSNENFSKDEEHILAHLENIYQNTKTQVRPTERLRNIKSHLKEIKIGGGGDGLMQAEWNDENGLSEGAEKSITTMLVDQQKQLDAMVALLRNDVSDMNILKGDLASF